MMMAHTGRPRDQPIPVDPLPPAAGVGLTDEELLAIRQAAAEEGYSELFADLLCRFAELIGTDEVLGELKNLEPRDP
jgi:hypothetical protein